MSNITQDIGNMIVLAKKAYEHVNKNKINKAKRELRKIIRLDVDELTRLQREHGDKKVIQECGIVFNDAKKALRDLDSLQLFDEAKQLIDEIIKLEGYELSKINEEEKILNKLYQYWYDNIYNSTFYHGTNSIAIDKIKVYGLVPGMTFWDKGDIIRLDYLIKKAGWRAGIGTFAQKHILALEEGKVLGIFLTSEKQSGIMYAIQTRGGEIWAEFFEPDNIRTNNRKGWVKNLYSIIGYDQTIRAIGIKKFNEIHREYDNNKKELLKYHLYCPLTISEINEVFRISDKYWNMIKDSKPVLLSISSHAPAIQEKMYKGNFKDFVEEAKEYAKGNLLNISEEIISHVIRNIKSGSVELEINKRIPREYIIKYEYV